MPRYYLAEADNRKDEAASGGFKDCASRPGGYCGERTAWVAHLMARDYYHEALKYGADRRVNKLRTAFRYESQVLGLRPIGFYRDGSLESSYELLEGVSNELGKMGRPKVDVDTALEAFRDRYGPC